MKSEITNEHLKMSNEDLEVIMQNGLITIKKIEKENYTLEDLEQKLVNGLCKRTNYSDLDVEIMKILFNMYK